MTNEERDNILDQHKTVYDGYVTSYVQPEKNQPLYVQDYANDKQGITVSNKGVVTGYKNMNINEMKYDGKSTGLFSEEEPMENHISPGSQFTPEESFESEEDKGHYVSMGEQLDMIGDGPMDLEHGTFEDDDSDDEYLRIKSGEGRDIYDDDEFMDYDGDEDDDEKLGFNVDDIMFDDIDDEEVDSLFGGLRESLDMFKRFTKYN
jgi:hypothetical protein